MTSVLDTIFDEVFKAPAETALNDLEAVAAGAVKVIVSTAKTDFAAAEAAVSKALGSSEAALDGVVGPAVQAGITALTNSVPALGPLFSSTVGQTASTAAIAIINGLIAELQKVL